jgi:glycosyltransferase involved in cell wall biosynthesis
VLRHITAKAAIGLSTDKPDSINHRYGLPNKLFDYIHAGVPVLSTRLVEIEKIITRYEVGTFLENNDPRQTAAAIEHIFSTPDQLQRWKNNTARAKQELNWEKESQAIIRLFHTICTDPNEN